MKKQDKKLLLIVFLILVDSLILGIDIANIPFFGISDYVPSQDLFREIFTTIIQGFIGLVAFLGAVAVFMLQNQRLNLKDAALEIERSDPQGILNHHREIIKKSIGEVMNKKKYLREWKRIKLGDEGWFFLKQSKLSVMHQAYTHEWEIRNKLMFFTTISFFNVGLALSFLIFVLKLESLSAIVGRIIISSFLMLSVISLVLAWDLVRRGIGFASRDE